jgi:anti-sigma28 factor (negative regulator of flagellin synthesis)
MDSHPGRPVFESGSDPKQLTSDFDQSHLEHEPHSVGRDAIVLPSRTDAIQQAQKIAREAPEMRQELIAQLQHALHLGTLTLDSHLIAEKLLGIQIDDVRSAA